MKLFSALSMAVVCVAFALSSCRSHKSLVKETMPKAASSSKTSRQETDGDQVVSKLIANQSKETYVTAKMKFAINGMGKDISVGGSIKMKRDDVIQLSLVAFGIIEAGKMEFTKDYVLVIDRLNKRYIQVPYNKVDFLSVAHLDFNVLQSLFWNELFVPGKAVPSDGDFTVVKSADNANATLTRKDKMFAYSFIAGLTDYLVHQVTVTSESTDANSAKVDWKYSDFTTFNGHSYPGQIAINVAGLKQPLSVTMKFSRINNDSGWETRIKVNPGYERMELDDLVRALSKMSGN